MDVNRVFVVQVNPALLTIIQHLMNTQTIINDNIQIIAMEEDNVVNGKNIPD